MFPANELGQDNPKLTDLYERSKELFWNPTRDIPWSGLQAEKMSASERDAARWMWSRQTWAEYNCAGGRLAAQVLGSRQELAFIPTLYYSIFQYEEFRHAEACQRLAQMLGGYVPPVEEYVNIYENTASRLSKYGFVEGSIASHVIKETFAIELFKLRVKNSQNPTLRELTRLILRDEVRHGEFGWIYLEDNWKTMSEEARESVMQAFHASMSDDTLLEMNGGETLPKAVRDREEEYRRASRDAGLGVYTYEDELKIIFDMKPKIEAKLNAIVNPQAQTLPQTQTQAQAKPLAVAV
jgi:hypothetical protein